MHVERNVRVHNSNEPYVPPTITTIVARGETPYATEAPNGDLPLTRGFRPQPPWLTSYSGNFSITSFPIYPSPIPPEASSYGLPEYLSRRLDDIKPPGGLTHAQLFNIQRRHAVKGASTVTLLFYSNTSFQAYLQRSYLISLLF